MLGVYPAGYRRQQRLRRIQRTGVQLVGAGLALLAGPFAAHAQNQSILIDPVLPDDFDRGRNVGVVEQPQPGYDPIGIQTGGFEIYPRVQVGAGLTDNVYFSSSDTVSDAFLVLAPAINVQGAWAPVDVELNASADLWRYLDEPRRNQNDWRVDTTGRIDLAQDYQLRVDLRALRETETPFSGEVAPEDAVLSPYTNFYGRVLGQFEAGQTRATIAVDHSIYDFSAIELSGGRSRSQAERDREISRVTAQAEYALSPSIAFYGRATVGWTDYDNLLDNGDPNRDSDSYTVSVGTNLDLSRLMRGSIGVGYSWRDYDFAGYDKVSGVSVEAKVEYFPTELTTFTFDLRRSLRDSTLGGSNAYFDNRVSLRADHALLRNLTLSIDGQYAHQDYIDEDRKTDVFSITGAADYAVSRNLRLVGSVRYLDRNRSTTGQDSKFNEFQTIIGIVLQQ